MTAITINLGKVLISPKAQETLATLNHAPSNLLDRHALCDWSELDAEDTVMHLQTVGYCFLLTPFKPFGFGLSLTRIKAVQPFF